jgi:hypothetical protein
MIAVEQRIVDCLQGDADWFKARLGVVTSSRIAKVISKPKRVKKAREGEPPEPPKELEGRKDMRYELACELLTGRATEHYVSRWMKEGKEKEPVARVEYEIKMGVPVRQIGFIYHPTIARAGASPDGLVAEDGLIEIKCPTMETHFEYLETKEIPEDYLKQMCWQLACCEDRLWNDFVSYCPAFDPPHDVFRKRLERTKEVDALIRGMEAEVVQFNHEVDELLNKIRG